MEKFLDKSAIPLYAYYGDKPLELSEQLKVILKTIESYAKATESIEYKDVKRIYNSNCLDLIKSSILKCVPLCKKYNLSGVIYYEIMDCCNYTEKVIEDVCRRKSLPALLCVREAISSFLYNLECLVYSLYSASKLRLLSSIIIVPFNKFQVDLTQRRGIVLNTLSAEDFSTMTESVSYLITSPILDEHSAGFTVVFSRTGTTLEATLFFGVSVYTIFFDINDLTHANTVFACCECALSDWNSLKLIDEQSSDYATRLKAFNKYKSERSCQSRKSELYEPNVCIKSNKYSYNCTLGTYKEVESGVFISLAEMSFISLNYLKDSLVIEQKKIRKKSSTDTSTSTIKTVGTSSSIKTPVKELNSIVLYYNDKSLNRIYARKTDLKRELKVSGNLGVSKQPHERSATVRHLKNGTTVNVKACIIHKDKYNGVRGYVIE